MLDLSTTLGPLEVLVISIIFNVLSEWDVYSISQYIVSFIATVSVPTLIRKIINQDE